MPVRWLVDDEAVSALWRELESMPLRLVAGPGQWVADLGGGNGNFVWVLRGKGARLVAVDVDVPALRSAPPDIGTLAASVLCLPLRTASVDACAGRAVLHHVPDDLDGVLREARRILKPGGLVLFQEPAAGNPLANAARRRFPTERHDPHERPLPYDVYVAAVRRHFDVLEARPHFLLSYLVPHLVGRMPPARRGLGRALARLFAAWDRRLLAALPGLRSRAAYLSVLARVPSE